MAKYGPGKGELYFRLAFSIAGLILLAAVLLWRGVPQGPAFFEVVVVAGGFFGASAVWTLRKLLRYR